MQRKIVFDKEAFIGKLRSEVWILESKVEKNLADAMKSEGADKVDNSFKDTLAQFKASVNVYSTAISTTSNKVSFPDEVYKVLLAKHIPSVPQIKEINPKLVNDVAAYIAGILGTNETVTTKDGKSYVVNTNLANAGLATVTYEERLYILDWKSDKAKNSLYGLLENLTTWGQNFQTYFFNELKKDVLDDLLGKWFKALLNNNGYVAKEVYESIDDYLEAGGDATDIPSFAADNYSKWLKWLSDLTKKYFPGTNSKVADFRKIFQTLDDRAKDTALLKEYKDGSEDLTAATIKGYDSYKNFITAYNALQTAIGQSTSNFDSLIPDYIGYKITSVDGGTFSEDKATISCAGDNNEITITGSGVSVNTWRGNDTITSGTYDAAGSSNTINAGAGDDEIYNYSSNSTIDAGTGDDFIRSDSHGERVSIVGGKGSDTVDCHGNRNRIEGGAGNDSISNYGSDATISGDDGADTIRNFGSGGSVLGGAGDDELLVMGGYVDGGTGVDTIAIQGSNVTAYGGANFDDMLPTKDVFNIASGASNVYIKDFEFGDVLNLPAGTYTARIEFGSTAIRNSSGKLIVCLSGFTDRLENFTYVEDDKQATDGDDSINNDVSNIKIDLGAGDDYIKNGGWWYEGYERVWHNGGNNVSIDLGAGNDTIYNNGDSVTINGGADNDSIVNYGDNVTIDAGEGNDSIRSYGDDVTINAGDGNDYISGDGSIDAGEGNNTIYSSYDTTVKTGLGDDSISIRGGFGSKSLIDAGDGNNTIGVYADYSTVDATVKTGTDDDYISIYSGSSYNYSIDVDVDAGNGNNTVIASVSSYSTINAAVKTDSGNDYISIHSSGYSSDSSINANVNAGDGNNTVEVYGYYYSNATVKTGIDDDYISIYDGGGSHSSINANVNAGEGNNTVRVNGYSHSTINATIKTASGDDVISINGGSKSSIDVDTGNGNNTVHIYGYSGSTINATVKTGDGDDFVSLYGGGSINAGNGNNTVYARNYYSNATIRTASGDDIISISGSSESSVDVDAGEGNNTIYSDFSNATIKTGSGDDYVSLYNGGQINAGEGNNTVMVGGYHKATVKTGSGDDSISISGDGLVLIDAGAGDDFISLYGGGSIDAGGGNNTVYGGDIVKTGSGDDYVSVQSHSSIDSSINVDAGDGNNTVKVYAYHHTVNAAVKTGSGDDFVSIYSGSVDAGSGDDFISIYDGGSIDAGMGNDQISLGAFARYNLIKYTAGDGNDTIWGSDLKDTLSISGGEYIRSTVGNDVIITVGDGSILLKNARYGTIHIDGEEGDPTRLTLTNNSNAKVTLGAEVVTADASARTTPVAITGNARDNSIIGGAKADTLDGGAGNDTLTGGWGADTFIYTGGKDIITDYAANFDKILLNGDGAKWLSHITDANVNGNDVTLTFSNDSNKTLTLKNAVGKKILINEDACIVGRDGNRNIIIRPAFGDGKDVIFGFDDSDMLQITGDWSANYYNASGRVVFKVGSTYSAIILENSSATIFNVNGDSYAISGSKLVKTS